MSKKILLLEDDHGIHQLLSSQLTSEGYQVISAYTGDEAKELFDDSIHLAILDIMVPGASGIEILKFIRESSLIPVLFLTAKDADIDKVMGLGLGADDYITKPFSLIEVVYRVKAHLRRYVDYNEKTVEDEPSTLTYGDIHLDIKQYEASFMGESISLSVKEFELLAYFMKHPGQVFTKQQLYETIWDAEYYDDDNTIMVHISRIRDKLKDRGKKPKYIKTIKGLGYRMEKI